MLPGWQTTTSQSPSKRKACTLALVTLARLERLKRLGSHGTTVSGIMTAFIEAGVREVAKEGYIRLEDDE